MVVVPLYDTLGPDACSYIINQSKHLRPLVEVCMHVSSLSAEIQLVLVDKSKKAEGLLKKRAQCPTLRIVVLLEPAEPTLSALAEKMGVTILSFQDLERMGEGSLDHAPPAMPPKPDDLCTISYTSGTTGAPKGAMLTHGNIIADTTALSILKYSMATSSDVMISYLPLAHMFERLLEAQMFSVGGRVGFSRGDVKLLMDDIKELRPTFLPVVPRILNRIYDKVTQEARKHFIKGFLLDRAVKSKSKDLQK